MNNIYKIRIIRIKKNSGVKKEKGREGGGREEERRCEMKEMRE
jgi:hypothetical protein